MIVFKLFFTNSSSESMVLSRLFQSFVLISLIKDLNSSITKGSIGFDTRLFCFLKVLVVEPKPPDPPILIPVFFMKDYLVLKSED